MAKQTFTTGQVLTAAQMTSLQQTAMGGGSATAKTASYTLVAADAGTTVIMNSASATTITVNTSLFSAGDSVFLQNIGAGVCTVTAGTATVSTAGSLALSQYEGGLLYFTAAGASIFHDYVQSSGSASALTQIVPTSTANSGGTVSTSASGAVTFSGVTSVSMNGIFTSTYTNYLITTDGIVGTGNADFYMRMRASGSDTTTGYDTMLFTKPFATGVAAPVSIGTTAFGNTAWYVGDCRTTDFFANSFFVSGPQVANYTTMTGFSTSRDTFNSIGAQQTASTQFDGATLYVSSNAVSGVFRVYGYSK